MAVFVGGTVIPDAGLETPNSPEPELVGGLIAVTRRYWVPNSNLAAFLAGLSTADTDATWTDAKLVSAGVSQVGDTNAVKQVEIRYEPPEWSFTIIPEGVTQEADANPIEVPYSQGPNSPSAGEIEAAAADGIEAVLVPMPIYRRTEQSSGSFTWSQDNIIDNVGKIDNAPAGMTSPSAGRWLMTEHKVTERGGVISEQHGWQYNETGWDTAVYKTAT